MDGKQLGILVAGVGVLLIIVGILIWSGVFAFFGRLPGDIRYEGEQSKFYFPIVSLLLVTIVINVLLWLFRKWF